MSVAPHPVDNGADLEEGGSPMDRESVESKETFKKVQAAQNPNKGHPMMLPCATKRSRRVWCCANLCFLLLLIIIVGANTVTSLAGALRVRCVIETRCVWCGTLIECVVVVRGQATMLTQQPQSFLWPSLMLVLRNRVCCGEGGTG